jgi:hypothetical protein
MMYVWLIVAALLTAVAAAATNAAGVGPMHANSWYDLVSKFFSGFIPYYTQRGLNTKRPTVVFFLTPTKNSLIIWIGKPAPAEQY